MSLSNIDLENIAHSLRLPIVGVFSKDCLPKKLSVGSYYINMQNNCDDNGNPLSGTHWVFARVFNKRQCVYFDSFGIDMPREVQQFLSPFKPIPFSNREIQDIHSEHCGLYCVACDQFFQYDAESRLSVLDNFEKFLSMFSNNTKLNDRVLKEYLAK